MKNLLFLVAILPSTVLAELATIHQMYPEFIKLEDGRVIYNSSSDKKSMLFYPRGTLVEIELTSDHELISLKAAEGIQFSDTSEVKYFPRPGYRSSTYSTYSEAQISLDSFRFPDAFGSQCYDRAHIWAYEAGLFSSNYLKKMWLFFSDHYIETNKFKWWFHVAPVAKVNMKGINEPRIMDRAFSQFPLKIKIWTDLFMVQKQECRLVSYYTDYSEHPNEDDCYLIESNPYYWQPRDLEKLAKKSIMKSRYIETDISHAYKFGFGIDQ